MPIVRRSRAALALTPQRRSMAWKRPPRWRQYASSRGKTRSCSTVRSPTMSAKVELTKTRKIFSTPDMSRVDPLLNVVGALARSELDDAKVGEPAGNERIVLNDRLDLLPALADREDDPAISRDLSARHEKIAGGILLIEEGDVRGHVLVDFCEVGLVNELDDEHAASLPQTRGPGKSR